MPNITAGVSKWAVAMPGGGFIVRIATRTAAAGEFCIASIWSTPRTRAITRGNSNVWWKIARHAGEMRSAIGSKRWNTISH